MSNASPLQAAQELLEQRGVRDVKFFFNPDLMSRSPSAVAAHAGFLLSTYLQEDGYKKASKPVGELNHIG